MYCNYDVEINVTVLCKHPLAELIVRVNDWILMLVAVSISVSGGRQIVKAYDRQTERLILECFWDPELSTRSLSACHISPSKTFYVRVASPGSLSAAGTVTFLG